MSEVRITVGVGDKPDLKAVLDADIEIVKKEPDCCVLCRANDDPGAVPVHAHCRCRAVTVNIREHIG